MFFDFETGSKFANTTQPTQLAGIMIEPRNLEIVSDFKSFIKPLEDEKAIEFGLDLIEQEALDITKIKREEIDNAPSLKAVWENFCQWASSYNKNGNKWNAPIPVGYNILNFDLPIIDRIAGGHFNEEGKKIYGFGPWDEKSKRTKVFHPRDRIDLMNILFLFLYENDPEYKSLSFDNARDYLGLTREGAHNAMQDCLQGVAVFTRYVKYIRRHTAGAKFKGAFSRDKNES